MSEEIIVTQANTNQEIYVFKNKVFGYYYSDAHKCNLIISDAGGAVPVKESKEQLDEILFGKKPESKLELIKGEEDDGKKE